MEIKVHEQEQVRIAEISSESILITSAEDGLDLLGNLYYQGFDRIILHAKNITPGFFELETGIAGELLQKFSNYRVRLAIVGDWDVYESKSLKDFIFESNKGGHVNFVRTSGDAVERLLRN